MSQSITNISLVAAFSAGLLSFVSPCVLPLVPSYISYITGLSIEQLTDSTVRSKFKKAIVVNALLFIAGFQQSLCPSAHRPASSDRRSLPIKITFAGSAGS